MSHFLYILHSKTIDHFYVGETPNLENRLAQHNQHYFLKSFTKSAEDWKIVLSMEYKDKTDALYIERFIKRMKSKKFIQKIIDKPEILNEILNKR